MPPPPDREADRPPDSYREIETKFDIPADFTIPDLTQLSGRNGQVEVDTVSVLSTYHDTATMDLLHYRLTLRRREGTTEDSGWQLKVPGSGFRTELRWPAGDSTDDPTDGPAGDPTGEPAGEPAGGADRQSPPTQLLTLLQPFLRGATPTPAVRLEVTRERHRLRTGKGTLLAEVVRDDVRASSLAVTVRAARWHESEVELGPAGDAQLLARVGRQLAKAGALPSTSRSKLARAVLGIGNEPVGTALASAGAVILDYLGQQSDALVAGHFGVHYEHEDAIHSTRVACRRMRSTLGTFGSCFDAERAQALQEELRWYAGLLGGVRDREVLRLRLAQALARLSADLIVGPVAERIDGQLSAELAANRSALLAAMDGARYAQFLAAVASWIEDPPFTAAAGRPARTLQPALQRARHKLSRQLARASAQTGTETDMHGARKAGKRLRYAAEALEGEDSKLVRQARALQDLLGEFQDSVIAAEVLRRLAAEAAARGEDGFTYGVLLAEQRARADAARAAARAR